MRSTMLITSALLMSLPILRASAEANANAPRIRIIEERAVDPKMESKHGKKRAEKLAGRSVRSLEFVGADGKVKKTVDLTQGATRLPEGVVELREARAAKTGRRVAVERRRHDTKERNPYKLRGGERVEVVWYDEAGEKLGARSFRGASSIRAMSADGSLTILVDEGFDLEGFEGYHDVPGLKTLETLKRDPELVDHMLFASTAKGEIVWERRIPGPGYNVSDIAVSPSGKWLVYSLASTATYVYNVESKSEERFDYLPIRWEVGDDGVLVGWKLEKDGTHYERRGEDLVAVSGPREYRKYLKKPGAPSPVATEETRGR